MYKTNDFTNTTTIDKKHILEDLKKMKATGMIRRIDDLGRIVIPKEIRKTMHIRESDPLEIFTEKDGDIILKKYSPIGEMGESAMQFAQSVASQTSYTVCICDQDCVIASAGPGAKKLLGKELHANSEKLLSERKNVLLDLEKEEFSPIISDFPDEFRYLCLATIISDSEAIGLVCILSEKELSDQELMITKIGATFLGKQLEG